MSLVQDVTVTTVSERLSYLSVKFASGASQLLAFIDDSRKDSPEYDSSPRRKWRYENLSASLSRPYTRGERVWLFFDGIVGMFVGFNFLVLGIIFVIGLIGAVFGVWSFESFGRMFSTVLIIDLMAMMPAWIWTRGYPKYPNPRLEVPADELAIDRKIVAAWRENDLGAALDVALKAR